MLNDPLVSIILLTFNSARYIGRALSSVYTQNYSNMEVIVVDAGSSDSTKSIVHSFSGTTWLDLPKSDMGMARNYGLDHSNGAFVMFLDSDDIYLEGKLTKQVQALVENKELDFVASQAYVMKNMSGSVGIKDWTFNKLTIDSFLEGQCYSLATLCIRKSALTSNCRFYENDAGRYCEDWSFQFTLLLEGLCFDVMPFCSVLVELRDDSHTDWSIQPKMKSIGLEVVESAFSIIEADELQHCVSNKQYTLDNYKFKLAMSYFANGFLDLGRSTLGIISNDYKAYKVLPEVASFILPKFLFIYVLRYLWSKRQESSFEWAAMPLSTKEWIDKHNKYLNY